MNHRNLFASYLVVVAPFVFLRLTGKSPAWRILAGITLALSLYNLVLTTSRAAWVGFLGATVVVVGVLAKVGAARSRTIGKWVAIGGVSVVAVVTFALLTADIELRTTDSGRLALWGKTVAMIMDHPWLGVGAGNWKIAMPAYGLDGLSPQLLQGMVQYQRPHNDFLWVFAETGMFGFLSYLAIFAISFYYIAIIIRRNCDLVQRDAAWAMVFGLTGFFIVSQFSFPKERIAHGMMLVLMLIVVVSLRGRIAAPEASDRRLVPTHRRSRMLAFKAGIYIVLAVAFVLGASRFASERHVKRALIAKADRNWQNCIDEIDRAETTIYRMDPTAAPIAWHRGIARFSLNDVQGATGDFKLGMSVHPNHIHVLNNLASCYAKRGETDRAVELYERALRISPTFEEALLNLATVYYNNRQYNAAQAIILRCEPNSDNPKVSQYRNLLLRRQHD